MKKEDLRFPPEHLHRFSSEERKDVEHTLFAMFLAIAAQVVVFPALGAWGAIIVAACAMVPLIVKFGRGKPGLFATTSITAIVVAPFWQLFMQFLVMLAKGVL